MHKPMQLSKMKSIPSPNMKFVYVIFFFALFAAEGLGQSTNQIQKSFESEVKKLDKKFARKLEDSEDEYAEEYEKLKQTSIEKLEASQKKAMAEQDLDKAVRLRDIVKEMAKLKSPIEEAATDPFDNTSWEFLGSDQRRINKFDFKTKGKIVAESTYNEAGFRSLSENIILFNYGKINSTYIVFHRQSDPNLFKGYHSKAGKTRYLRKVD